jgi:hypothetical protein
MSRAFSAHNGFLDDEPGPLARAGMTDTFGVTKGPGLGQAEGLAHTSPVAPPWVHVAFSSIAGQRPASSPDLLVQ